MGDRELDRLFPGLDVAAFWADGEHGSTYDNGYPSDEMIASVEAELGVRLPEAYVALMRTRNGGLPRNTCCPAPGGTTWAEDHVAVNGILGIGRDGGNSLAGATGSRFYVAEWGYPDIGVYVADCPSAGHDMIALDYRECGPQGEPRVVHVDQEAVYRITPLAPDFAAFVMALRPDGDYDDGDD